MKKTLKKNIRSLRDELEYFTQRPKRILFDHLPKCAGTTIIEYILMHYPERLVYKTSGRKPSTSVKEFQALPKRMRYGYRLIVGHETFKLLNYVHPDTILFTIFRDPVERIISHYYFVKQDRQHYLHDQIVKLNLQLADYVCSGLSSELKNWYTKHYTGLSDGEIEVAPEKAVHHAARVVLERFDIIGFQDELTEVMQELRNTARLTKKFENKVLNKSRGKNNPQNIAETTKKTIAEVNSVDIELYSLLKARLSPRN